LPIRFRGEVDSSTLARTYTLDWSKVRSRRDRATRYHGDGHCTLRAGFGSRWRYELCRDCPLGRRV